MGQRVDITDEPTAVAGLVEGTDYFLQNQSPRNIFAEIATAAPMADGPRRVLTPLGTEKSEAELSLGAGESLYIWGPEGGGGSTAYLAETS